MSFKRKRRGRRTLGPVIAAVMVVAAVAAWAGFQVSRGNGTPVRGTESIANSGNTATVSALPAASVPAVCGQPVLRSPFSYYGTAGAYHSGRAGLPTYGGPKTDFPKAKAGVVLPAGARNYYAYNLRPNTVYYLLPGLHFGFIQAEAGDAFVGGYYRGATSTLSGQYHNISYGIDSNETDGNQPNVTVEFLTITKFQPGTNAAAVNQESNTGWIIRNNTITLNVPGAGVMLGASNALKNNCLTLNGQYGFQAYDTNSWGKDPLTGGPHDSLVQGNEISYNDTCDFEGLLNNPAIGWHDYNPVPTGNRNSRCGTVIPNGDQGGFKLWQTNNVTIAGNFIHNNYGPGAWADTNNANTTYTGNRITSNDDQAIVEEVSYNFAITGNYLAGNDLTGGLADPGFPQPAITVSESGSDTTFGGVPGKYSARSVISGNTLVNNGGGVFLWQNSNRYCSDGSDSACTLVSNGATHPFTVAACHSNLPSARLDTTTFKGAITGSPAEDWFYGCMWRTENVLVSKNTVEFNPAAIKDCTKDLWSACGANGVYSEYGSPPNGGPGWAVPTAITFFQNNVWSGNVYKGPSAFYAWNQGNTNNPIHWAAWAGSAAKGDKCLGAGERAAGSCIGPFGQDTGSRFYASP